MLMRHLNRMGYLIVRKALIDLNLMMLYSHWITLYKMSTNEFFLNQRHFIRMGTNSVLNLLSIPGCYEKYQRCKKIRYLFAQKVEDKLSCSKSSSLLRNLSDVHI